MKKVSRLIETFLFILAIIVIVIVAVMVQGCTPTVHYFEASNNQANCSCNYDIETHNVSAYKYDWNCRNSNLKLSGWFVGDNISIIKNCDLQ